MATKMTLATITRPRTASRFFRKRRQNAPTPPGGAWAAGAAAATSMGTSTAVIGEPPSRQPDPRVDGRVRQVDDEAEEHEHEDAVAGDRHDDRVVLDLDR